MTHSTKRTSLDDQISLLPQNEKNEIEEGRKVDHLIDINGQDPSGSQTKKSLNQIYAEEFKNLDDSPIKSCTIFKVNVWLRESNPDAYIPKIVSIGPYHKKKSQRDPMKKYKLLYLRRFLKRKEGLDVEICISELEKLKEEAIQCYDDVEIDEFCQLLLLDGCFVVEFIREYGTLYPQGEDKIININNIDYVLQDLMLLENQLPFFVLDKLHDMTKREDESPLAILAGILLPLFVDLPRETRILIIGTHSRCYNIKHLLHLIHILSCHGNSKKISANNYNKTGHIAMPNATELSEAGVSFVKEDKLGNKTSLFDGIKFKNGLMTIPCLLVQDNTEILLRNLIAYEQQSVDVCPKNFSNFATFIDHLIESEKDVNLLRKKGIIVNRIGEDKGVTNLFNKIGTGVITYPDFYYAEEWTKACQHCEKCWNRKMANLKHNYFSSPWVGASTVAAIILLILTTIQTILAFTGSVK